MTWQTHRWVTIYDKARTFFFILLHPLIRTAFAIRVASNTTIMWILFTLHGRFHLWFEEIEIFKVRLVLPLRFILRNVFIKMLLLSLNISAIAPVHIILIWLLMRGTCQTIHLFKFRRLLLEQVLCIIIRWMVVYIIIHVITDIQ